MNKLTQLLKDDMKPAFGVTEPGAIAFAVAKARSYISGEIECVKVLMNSGMYKNAFTCGIPNSMEVGNIFAAALGAIAGQSEKGLEALEEANREDNIQAKRLIDEGRIKIELSEISSVIFIEATVNTVSDICTVTIHDNHTNITKIVVNGKVEFEKKGDVKGGAGGCKEECHMIHKFKLADLYEYTKTVDISEIEFLREAYKVNIELLEEGLKSGRTTFAPNLLKMNHGEICSKDEQKTAQLLCNGAIEARVIGINKPAMSITGSGAHGIIATMPLYAVYKVNKIKEEKLLRATALSYLITMYIKEYSGRLSAFCGCAIAAGTGMACAMTYLKEGSFEQIIYTLNNMASSITGMICDGGNQGCAMKGIVAVDAAFKSVEFAMNGSYIENRHGINGDSPELTMKNMGLIASPGMVGTEKVIINILEAKLKCD